MGDGALTKEQLDAATAEWIEWRKGRDAPVAPNLTAKSVTASAVRPRTAALVKSIVVGIAPTIHALEQEVAELTKRVAELEAAQGEMRYCGVWREGKDYTPGSFATHDGAMWHANRKTSEKPGASGDWTMCAKSGVPTASPRDDATAPASPCSNGQVPANPRFR